MLTLLEQIKQKLPHASESVLKEIWTILKSAENSQELSESEPNIDRDNGSTLNGNMPEDERLYDEFDRWEAASDEDCEQLEEMLITIGCISG